MAGALLLQFAPVDPAYNDLLIVADPLPAGRVARSDQFAAVETVLAPHLARMHDVALHPTLVELAREALPRYAAIEPPKWHAVSGAVRECHARFASITADQLEVVSRVTRSEGDTK